MPAADVSSLRLQAGEGATTQCNVGIQCSSELWDNFPSLPYVAFLTFNTLLKY